MYKIQGDVVVNHRGDVVAQKVHGNWESKEQSVLDWIKDQEKPKTVKAKAKK